MMLEKSGQGKRNTLSRKKIFHINHTKEIPGMLVESGDLSDSVKIKKIQSPISKKNIMALTMTAKNLGMKCLKLCGGGEWNNDRVIR